MNYLVRNSIKIGLIASALLVFSACGSDEVSGGSNNPTMAEPIFDQQPIEAGDICEYGGIMVRGGLDADKNGELSEEEVKSKTPICNAKIEEGGETPAGPPLLVKTEALEIGDETCPDGGKRVHVGYDLDKDGELSAEEIAETTTKTTELCNSGPIDACVGADQLEIISIKLEEDEFGYHEVDRPYEVRVEFNKDIDTASFELKDILKTLGEDELVYTVDPDNSKIAILEFKGELNNESYSMAISANDGCTSGSAGLRTPELHSQQPRLNVSYDAPGFSAAGDKIEFCYESRGADTCETSIRTAYDPNAPLSGCIEITADATDMTNGVVPVRIICQDSQIPGSPIAEHRKLVPTRPTLLSFDSSEFSGLVESQEIDLHWETFQMESCILSHGTESNDVSVNESKHTFEIEETTEFVLTCKDADNNEYSKTHRITVGSGILSFGAYVSQRAPGFPLAFSANWQTSMLYGTCDVKFEYASTVLDVNNVNQFTDYAIDMKYRHGSAYANQQTPAEDMDSQIVGTATLTCKSTFGTPATQTLEVAIRH